jgi:hypothetical protein
MSKKIPIPMPLEEIVEHLKVHKSNLFVSREDTKDFDEDFERLTIQIWKLQTSIHELIKVRQLDTD